MASIDLGVPSNVLTGTSAQMWALTGQPGQQFYATNYGAMWYWSAAGRWWPLGNPDPNYGFLFSDEFMGSDRIGQLDWQTSGNAQNAGTALNQGIYKITNTTASSIQYFTTQGNAIQLGTVDFFMEVDVNLSALSDGTNNTVMVVGLVSNFSYDVHGAQTNGVTIRYDNANNGANLIGVCSSGSSETAQNSVIPFAATTWTRLGIFVQSNKSATFYAGGVPLGAPVVTNLPVIGSKAVGIGWNINKTLGAGSINLQFDYVSGWCMYNGPRNP